MWFFVLSEILLFGGLFLLYSVYRYTHAEAFREASAELSRFDGTLNTAVLITSSFTVALGIYFLGNNDRKKAMLLVGATIALASVFLVVKGFEWGSKFSHGIYPGSAVLRQLDEGELLYFGLYFVMTGLHAVHVIVGMCILTLMLVLMSRRRVTAERPNVLVNAGLYWHLVDIIWIFLFPLFYLIA